MKQEAQERKWPARKENLATTYGAGGYAALRISLAHRNSSGEPSTRPQKSRVARRLSTRHHDICSSAPAIAAVLQPRCGQSSVRMQRPARSGWRGNRGPADRARLSAAGRARGGQRLGRGGCWAASAGRQRPANAAGAENGAKPTSMASVQQRKTAASLPAPPPAAQGQQLRLGGGWRAK